MISTTHNLFTFTLATLAALSLLEGCTDSVSPKSQEDSWYQSQGGDASSNKHSNPKDSSDSDERSGDLNKQTEDSEKLNVKDLNKAFQECIKRGASYAACLQHIKNLKGMK